jgi:fluoride exporter
MNYLAVAITGSVDAVARFGLVRWLEPWSVSFPWAIFVVNGLGCLLFGPAWGVGSVRWPEVVQVAILAGFFGAFTTFSSFAFGCIILIEKGQVVAAAANAVGQNVLGGIAMVTGVTVGRAFTGMG